MGLANKFSNSTAFIKSVLKESKNLKFPTKMETTIYLIVVLAMAVVSAIIFFLIDKFAYKIVNSILMFFV